MPRSIPYSVILIAAPIAVFLLVMAAAVPFAATRHVNYETQARVWIQAQIPNYSGEQQNSAGLYLPFMTFFNSPIQTAAEIIRSSEVVREAADILKDRFPGKRLPGPGDIAAGLSCAPIKETDVLVVKYRGSEPQESADVLQAVLDGFIKISSMQSSASATNERSFLERQLGQAQAKLADASERLATFQKQHSISDMSHDAADLLKQTNDMRAKVHEDEVELQKCRSSVERLQARLAQAPANTDSALARALETKLGDEKMRLAEVSQSLKDEHPYVMNLKETIASTEQMLAKVKGTDDSDYSTLRVELNRDRVQIPRLETQLVGHRRVLADLEARCADLPSESVSWSELNREKELAAANVSELEKRLHSAKLMESVSQGTTNIKIIDKPAVPLIPVGPSKTVILALAGVAGAVLAAVSYIILRQFDPIVSSVQQAIALLPLPIAGIFGLGARSQQSHVNWLRRSIRRHLGAKKTLVVAGADCGAGTSALASALALSFAEAGLRVVLVDGNFHAPTLHQRFNVSQSPGLSDLVGSRPHAEPSREIAPNLQLVTLGPTKSSLFEKTEVIAYLHELQKNADLVIVDAPAAEVSPDCLALVNDSTLLLLAIRLRHTPKVAVGMLANQLAALDGNQPMLVFTDATESDLTTNVASKPAAKAEPGVAPSEQPVW